MTVADVADYLRLSRAKIYEMAQQHEIPCAKVAGRWRFKKEFLDEWMMAGSPSTAEAEGTQGYPLKKTGEILT